MDTKLLHRCAACGAVFTPGGCEGREATVYSPEQLIALAQPATVVGEPPTVPQEIRRRRRGGGAGGGGGGEATDEEKEIQTVSSFHHHHGQREISGQ